MSGLVRSQILAKRLLDLIISVVLVIFLFPLFVIIAVIIKADSQGPVFFTQERPGLGGRLFKVYKFRTMVLGSEKMIKGREVGLDDNRITKVGKTLRRYKIDELPQLFNVLKGEMSLVGPRPERVASVKDYTVDTKKRLNMKPGMTGLAQVSGNIHLPLEQRYKYDVYYVDNFSFGLDIRIMIRTIGVVIFGEDRYVDKRLVTIETDLL